jgi:hypothetical protein
MWSGRTAALAAMVLFAHAGMAQSATSVGGPTKTGAGQRSVEKNPVLRAVQMRDSQAQSGVKQQEAKEREARDQARRQEEMKKQEESRRREETKRQEEARQQAEQKRAEEGRREEERRRQESAWSSGDRGRGSTYGGTYGSSHGSWGGRDDWKGRDGGWSVRVRIGGGADSCWDRPEYRRPIVDCPPPATRLRSEMYVDGRRVEAEVTLWLDHCGDLQGRVELRTCDGRGLRGIRASLDANQGRKNRWEPCLMEVADCDEQVATYETRGSPRWDVDCIQVRLTLSSHCGEDQVEWRGVRVP